MNLDDNEYIAALFDICIELDIVIKNCTDSTSNCCHASVEIAPNGKSKFIYFYNLNLAGSEEEVIVIFAHEIGHILDYIYNQYSFKSWSFGLKHRRLKFEYQAWRNALQVLKTIHFPDWSAFLYFLEKSISTYCSSSCNNPQKTVCNIMKNFMNLLTK